jgi:hypothetical protein
MSAVCDEGANWLVRFVHPLFAYFKIASFLSLEISLAVLMGLSLWSVFSGSQQNYRSPEQSASTAPVTEDLE